MEVYGGGRPLSLDDFRRALGAEGKSVARWKSRGQDKSQRGALDALLDTSGRVRRLRFRRPKRS
jgi:hypothetical protein